MLNVKHAAVVLETRIGGERLLEPLDDEPLPRIITPAGESWDQWFDGPGVSDDFMIDREQPDDQDREAL